MISRGQPRLARPGFTFIEILVVTVLAAVLVGAVFNMLRIGFKSSGQGPRA